MLIHIFFLGLLMTGHSLSMDSTHAQQIIECEGKPIWRPHGHDLIVQKGIKQEVKKDPRNPERNLDAWGPVTGLYIFNPTTKTEELLENSHQNPFHMKCSDQSKYLAAIFATLPKVTSKEITIISSNQLKIWDLDTKKIVLQFLTAQNSFTLSPKQNYVACESEDGTSCVVRRILTGSQIASLKKYIPHPGEKWPVVVWGISSSTESSLAFSEDDTLFAFEDIGATYIIELDNPQEAPILLPGYFPQFGAHMLAMCFERTLSLYDTNHTIYDLATGQKTFQLLRSINDPLFGSNFSTLQFDKNFNYVTYPATQEPYIAFATIPNPHDPTKYLQGIEKRAVSPDFTKSAQSAFENNNFGKICIKDIKTEKTTSMITGYPYAALSHFFSTDNKYFFMDTGASVFIFNAEKGAATVIARCVKTPSSCSPDSTYLLRRIDANHALIIDLNALSYKK